MRFHAFSEVSQSVPAHPLPKEKFFEIEFLAKNWLEKFWSQKIPGGKILEPEIGSRWKLSKTKILGWNKI